MSEPRIMIAKGVNDPLGSAGMVYPVSIQGRCDNCREPVHIAPSTLKEEYDETWCLSCFSLREDAHDLVDRWGMAEVEGQDEELREMGITPQTPPGKDQTMHLLIDMYRELDRRNPASS